MFILINNEQYQVPSAIVGDYLIKDISREEVL